jgi:hypothetical protein
MYVRLLTSLLDGLDNALVSLCVWNAGSKYHAPDLALVMFEGLLLFGFISFYYDTLHNSSFDACSIWPFTVVCYCLLLQRLFFNDIIIVMVCTLIGCEFVWINDDLVIVTTHIWMYAWVLWAGISGRVVVKTTGIIQGVKQARLLTTRYLQLASVLACFRGVFAIVDIAVGRFG